MTRTDRYVNVVVGFVPSVSLTALAVAYDVLNVSRCSPLIAEAVPEPTNLSASTNVV
jgi:hypothetical protein